MQVCFATEGNAVVVKLIGELDEHSSHFVKQQLDANLSYGAFSAVIFDMSRLTFMDSTGIGLLLTRYKQLKDVCQMYVRSPSRIVDKILTMSGIYQIFKKL